MSLMLLGVVLGVALGYGGGRIHSGRIHVRLGGALSPEARDMLAAHADTLREIVRTTDGAVPPELEAALGRMLTPPLLGPLAPPPRPEPSDAAWEVFWADGAPEVNHDALMELLETWVHRVKWDAGRRAAVVKKFSDPNARMEVRRIIDGAWSVD